MASSIRAGIRAAKDCVAAMILLGDMPMVTSGHINAMLGSFGAEQDIIVATQAGESGNPVLFGSSHFDALANLEGDKGARHYIATQASCVQKVEIGPAAARDFDTEESFQEG